MRMRRVGFLLVLAALAVTRQAGAQQPVRVLDNGDPVAGVEVAGFLNQINKPFGAVNSTDDNGDVVIPADALDFVKGDRVAVWVVECEDGRVTQVILVRDTDGDPCVQEGARPGEGCGCRRLPGVVFWGDGPVTIDIGTGSVTQAGTGTTPATSRFVIGAGLDVLQMIELENVLEEVDTGATDHDATGWAPGFQLFAEWQFRRILALGLEGGFSRMETEVRFPQGLQTGDLDYYRVGLNAKVGLPTTGRIWPYGTFGWYRAWNKGDFEIDGLSDHRVHKTSLIGIGAGFDYRFRSNWGARFEGLYSSTFDDPDADEHIRWKFGLMYGLGRTIDYAHDRGGLYE